MSKLLTVATICATAIAITACRTSAIYNVEDSPITTAESISMDHVERAIINAGTSLGWSINKQSQGHMIGKLALRSHLAVVDITYDTSMFSIQYKESVNLKYDGANIHSNYNGWIQNLENAIRVQIAASS